MLNLQVNFVLFKMKDFKQGAHLLAISHYMEESLLPTSVSVNFAQELVIATSLKLRLSIERSQ